MPLLPGESLQQVIESAEVLSMEQLIRHLGIAPGNAGRDGHFGAPTHHLLVLGSNFDVFLSLGLDDPVVQFLTIFLHKGEVRIVGSERAARLKVLHMKAGEMLAQFGKLHDVWRPIQKAREVSLKSVVTCDHVEYGLIRDREVTPPGELGGIRHAPRVSDHFDRPLFGR